MTDTRAKGREDGTRAASLEGALHLARRDIVALRSELKQLVHEVSGLRYDLKATLTPKWKTKPFYTVQELAKHLGRSPYTIRRWIREGKIGAVKLNSGGPRDPYLIEHREVEELILRAEAKDHVLVSR